MCIGINPTKRVQAQIEGGEGSGLYWRQSLYYVYVFSLLRIWLEKTWDNRACTNSAWEYYKFPTLSFRMTYPLLPPSTSQWKMFLTTDQDLLPRNCINQQIGPMPRIQIREVSVLMKDLCQLESLQNVYLFSLRPLT